MWGKGAESKEVSLGMAGSLEASLAVMLGGCREKGLCSSTAASPSLWQQPMHIHIANCGSKGSCVLT